MGESITAGEARPHTDGQSRKLSDHLTQKEAVELLKISLKTLQNYESGKTKPNWDTLNKMSEVYKIPIGMFKCT